MSDSDGKEYEVIEIGYRAFKDCAGITAITFPSGINNVDYYGAFDGCTLLTSFAVEAGDTTYKATADGLLLSADGKTLLRCPPAKLGDVTLPEGITTINDDAFGGCSKLSTLTLPATLSYVDNEFLNSCSSLTKIAVAEGNTRYKSTANDLLLSADGKTLFRCPPGKTGDIALPEGITSIYYNAFGGCSKLSSITLPATLSTLPSTQDYYHFGCFGDCSSLTKIAVTEGNTTYKSTADGLLLSADGTVLVRCPRAKAGDLNLPEGITTIYYNAFSGCSKLNSITLPATLSQNIREFFRSCSSLTKIAVAEGNATYKSTVDGLLLSADTLVLCPAGKSGSLQVPEGITHIGYGAFSGCKELTNIQLNEGVTSIDRYAFDDCAQLTSVSLPATLTDLDYWMSVYVFCKCPKLTSINVAEGNTIYTSRDGLVLSADSTTLVCCPAGRSGALQVPEGITTIFNAAFRDCNQIETMVLGQEVTTILVNAFQGLKKLKSLSLYFGEGYAVQDLGMSSDSSDSTDVAVNLVGLPEKEKLDSLALMLSKNGCRCEFVKPLDIELSPSSGLVAAYQTIELPAKTADDRAITYSLSINGGEFEDIAESTYTFVPSVSTAQRFALRATAAKPEGYDGIDISCPSKMFEYYMDAADFEYSFDDEKGTATLTGVGASLTEAVLPDSVWTGGKGYVLAGLGKGAFKGLADLTSVTLPDGLEAITDEAFFGCEKLAHIGVNTSNRSATVADVTWPSRLRSIGAGAFNGCSGMAGSLELPATLESIGEGAFKACSALTEVSLNLNSTTKIAESAFEGCSELTKVTVNAPEGIEGSQLEAVAKVFTECSKLTTVEVKAPTGTDTSKLSEVLGSNVKVEVSTLALRIVGQGSGSKARSGAYDLSGHRVGENHRGLVIEQGKLRLRK